MAATEIISGPLAAYIAPVGTAFPTIQTVPADPWSLIGESGTRSMSEDGLTVENPQEFFEVRVAGSTAVQKVFRTSEGLTVSFTLYDLQLEEYSRMLNDNMVEPIDAATGTAAQKKIGMYRGLTVSTRALLVRGNASPEEEGESLQYEVPLVWQSGAPSPVFNKGEVAGLAFQFMALFDESADAGHELGTLRYRTGPPS